MAKEKSNIELERKQALKDISIKSIFLEKLEFRKNESSTKPSNKYKLEFTGGVIRQPDKKLIECLVTFNIQFQETNDRKAPFSLTLGFKMIFKCKSTPQKQKLKNFVRNYLTPIIWPYTREIISIVTARAGFSPLYLPILELPEEMTVNSK